MTQLSTILARLVAENLHAPVNVDGPMLVPPTHEPRKSASQGEVRYGETDDQSEDSSDPRWFALFQEFFLDNNDSKNDDLLFFVRQKHLENEHLDPVFVKRKMPQAHVVPQLDDLVKWKETFFLNLIVQLPCRLSVAVCKRAVSPEAVSPQEVQRTSMICSSKYVSTRVYALPTRSRVDIKDTAVECSYPLIYYLIDDYEEMFEHLIVTEDEHLCVELAVTIPEETDDGEYDSDGLEDSDDDYFGRRNPRRRSWTNGPFPHPSNGQKITLFQGAAPFSGLASTYKQKTAGKTNKRFKMGSVTPPTEFVMMRGPNGKGLAQVAITATMPGDNPPDVADEPVETTSPSAVPDGNGRGQSNGIPRNPTLSSAQQHLQEQHLRYPPASKQQRSQDDNQPSRRSPPTSNFFQSLKRISQLATYDRSILEPESLKCCMMFVNVPWTSIVSDLITYARKRHNPIP